MSRIFVIIAVLWGNRLTIFLLYLQGFLFFMKLWRESLQLIMEQSEQELQ